jgi:hypothetical protein
MLHILFLSRLAVQMRSAFVAAVLKKTIAFGAFLLSSLVVYAQGGPPMRTDDPGTPGNKAWEVNFGVTTDRRAHEREFEIPVLDINYGVGQRIQLNYEIPYVVSGADAEPTRSGLGNSSLAVKWRFFEDEKTGLSLSIYPRLELNNPTRSFDRGLVDGGPRFLLPMEIVKKLGPIDVNGEVGHWFTQEPRGQWIAGLAVGRQVTDRTELMAEIYSVRGSAQETQTTYEFGSRVRLNPYMLFMVMAGRAFEGGSSGQPEFIGYGGIQFQFKSRHEKELEKTKESSIANPAHCCS